VGQFTNTETEDSTPLAADTGKTAGAEMPTTMSATSMDTSGRASFNRAKLLEGSSLKTVRVFKSLLQKQLTLGVEKTKRKKAICLRQLSN
jgi:hypothetical protein